MSKESNSSFPVLLVGITVCGAVLRLIGLENQSFWYDEVVSAQISQAPLLDILSGQRGDLGNPPFYYYLLGVWRRAVGSGDSALRCLSALLSVACIPVMHAVGRRLFDDRVGIVAAAALAISPFHVYMAQEARAFALVSFLALASTHVLLGAVRSPEVRWRWSLYALLVFLIPFSHYFGFFFLAGQFGFTMMVARNKAALRGYLIAVALGALVYCTWLPAFFRQLSAENNLARSADSWYLHVAATPMAFSVGTVLFWKSAGALWRVVAAGTGTLVLGGVVLVGLWRARSQRESVALPFASLATTIGIPLLLSVTLSPLYNVRYVFLASPFWLLFAAVGLVSLGRRMAIGAGAVYAAAATAALFIQYTTQFKDDWRGASRWLSSRVASGALLAFYPDIGETAFSWYSPTGAGAIRLLPPPDGNAVFWGTDHAGGIPKDVSSDLGGDVCLVMSDEPDDYYREQFERYPSTARTSQFVGVEIECANLATEAAGSKH